MFIRISEYLSRFKGIEHAEISIEKKARDLFERELGVTIHPRAISIKGKTLHVTLPPYIKMEIITKGDFFLEELKKISAGRIAEIR